MTTLPCRTPAGRWHSAQPLPYLMAGKTGDTALMRKTAREKARALHTLESTPNRVTQPT